MKSLVSDLMKAKGLTVRALCERTGLSIQTIMTARTCGPKGICKSSMDTLSKIAKELGVSVADLFTDQPDPE
ncbi:MAG: XRE family transcriptional regulator [Clostridia bacterium]|nr:XRE family transcriptional regulator [Clostridia bacterium]